jgi:hypothetical protein
MMTAAISWISLALLFMTSIGLLLARDWRWSLGLLAFQYMGMFWLVQLHWPVAMAAVKLVTGWMVAAVLGITLSGLSMGLGDSGEKSWPSGRLFRIFTAALVLLPVISVIPNLARLLPGIGLPEISASLLLIGMGLLHLGITAQPLRIILGLLTVLAGFEILYAAVEGSVLVAALLALTNLGLALIGSYFLIAGPEPSEEVG